MTIAIDVRLNQKQPCFGPFISNNSSIFYFIDHKDKHKIANDDNIDKAVVSIYICPTVHIKRKEDDNHDANKLSEPPGNTGGNTVDSAAPKVFLSKHPPYFSVHKK